MSNSVSQDWGHRSKLSLYTWAIFSIMKIDTKPHFHFQDTGSIDFSGVLIKKYEDMFLRECSIGSSSQDKEALC